MSQKLVTTRTSYKQPIGSKGSRTNVTKNKAEAGPSKKKFELPALSVSAKPKPSFTTQWKNKTIRRNAPEGEDMHGIKKLIATIKEDKHISVGEFAALLAPYTADKGEIMRNVLNEDMTQFTTMARKVFEAMATDTSNVLQNQQIQIAEHIKESRERIKRRMISILEVMCNQVPNFDLNRFNQNKEAYMNEVLPIPPDLDLEPEELEILKRQQMFHRLQWLRSEGDRLREENEKLTERLKEMKKVYMEEQNKASVIEETIVKQREYLEATEASQREKLDTINESLEKAIITEERTLRREGDKVPIKKSEAGPSKSKTSTKSKQSWAVKTAKQLEAKNLEKAFETRLGHTGDRRTQYSRSGESRMSKTAPKKKPEYILEDPEVPREPPNVIQTKVIKTRRTNVQDKSNRNKPK